MPAHNPNRGTAALQEAVPVLLPLPLRGPLDYAAPETTALVPGTRVVVPLGGREVTGVVWDGAPGGGIAGARLRPIRRVLEAAPLGEDLRRLVDWIAAYTLAAPGEVLAMALRALPAAATTAPAGWRLAPAPPASTRITEARRRVLALLGDGRAWRQAELAARARVTPALLRAMAAAGFMQPAPLAAEPPFALPDAAHPGPTLGPGQAEAAEALRQAVAACRFSVTLLEGVTGSGKTEVYLEAVAECLRAGRQALVLLPEIALSAQWVERFVGRFGAAPALWHSDLSTSVRRATARAVAAGEVPVVVGARSALFLPFPDLGLVIVDEEHESGFKQEEGVIYHARDMAVVRARFDRAATVLVSATPSL